MKLSECKFGVIVEDAITGEVGIVVGITEYKIQPDFLTKPKRCPIPLVQFQNGVTMGVKPSDLLVYED